MCHPRPQPLTAIHAQLLLDLDRPACRILFAQTKERHAALAAFDGWAAVADALNRRGISEADSDALLAPIIAGYAAGTSPLWGLVLCACCFRSLVATYRPRQHWHADADEVWQESVATFFEVCHRIAARASRSGLRRRIANETSHRLHEAFTSRWRSDEAEHPTDPVEMSPVIDHRLEPACQEAARDLAEQQDLLRARLSRHRQVGTISVEDHALLVQVRIEGLTLREAGETLGLTHAAAKKRSQRAEQAMARAERAD